MKTGMKKIEITEITVERLFEKYNFHWKIPKGRQISVLVGENGVGKSTVLDILRFCLVSQSYFQELDKKVVRNNDISDLGEKIGAICRGATIKLGNKEKVELFINRGDEKKIDLEILSDVLESLWGKLSESEITISEKSAKIKKLQDMKNELLGFKEKNIENVVSTVQVGLKRSKKTYFPGIQYISTLNMNANSIQSINKSDGSRGKILNIEIETALHPLFKLTKEIKKDFINKLEEVLNYFFKDSDKRIALDNDELIVYLKKGNEEETISMEYLSSGERQLIYTFIMVVMASESGIPILMDEPEISLHLKWQRDFLKKISEVNSNSQIIIVTHSPAIIMDGWNEAYVDFSDLIQEGL